MNKIIPFPVPQSNGYKNLVALFDVCNNLDSCNFYLETVERLFENDDITEKELYTLRRIGRTKRLELAAPAKQDPVKADKPGTYLYTPEMGQEKPDCQMEASHSYYGGHYFIDTPLELKGRGITFLKKYESKDFVNPNNRKVGWNEYRVTTKAFNKLKEQYTISMELLLD